MTEQFERELAAWDLGHESGMDEAEAEGVSMSEIREVVDVNDPGRGILSIIKAHAEVGEYLSEIDADAYARGLSDGEKSGAEKERALIVAWLEGKIADEDILGELESGDHLKGQADGK